mmetsp:Transcript_103518/g.231206  ORF Transcript_103518/g.231206 Transcript_103518/m.231206 type:complete len:202 (-) Transcript_103518:112-717(-)
MHRIIGRADALLLDAQNSSEARFTVILGPPTTPGPPPPLASACLRQGVDQRLTGRRRSCGHSRAGNRVGHPLEKGPEPRTATHKPLSQRRVTRLSLAHHGCRRLRRLRHFLRRRGHFALGGHFALVFQPQPLTPLKALLHGVARDDLQGPRRAETAQVHLLTERKLQALRAFRRGSQEVGRLLNEGPDPVLPRGQKAVILK